jgi:hypothetical protein
VLVTASHLTKLSLAKVREKFSMAKARKFFLSLFAQVRFTLAGFGVICSQDHTWRIFQFAHLCLGT